MARLANTHSSVVSDAYVLRMVPPDLGDDRHPVRHPGQAASNRVLDAVEELEPGRRLTRRQVGVLAERHAGVRRRVGIDDRFDREDATEVRASDRSDPTGEFAHEFIGGRRAPQPTDPDRAQ